MIYFFNKKDLSMAGYRHDVSYTLYDSSNDKSQVIIEDDGSVDFSGSWAMINNRMYFVDGGTPKNGTTTITLLAPYRAFGRNVFLNGNWESIGDFIESVITEEFVEQSDDEFAMPYLTINDDSSIAFIPPATGDDGLFNLAEYLEYAQASGLSFDIRFTGTGLEMMINDRPESTSYAIMGDGHNILQTESYSHESVSKITIRKPDGTEPPVWTSTTYYLSEDGEISTTVPEHRAVGEWMITSCGTDGDTLQIAGDTFSENKNSHKVEFWSDLKLEYLSNISIRFENGRIFKTKITKIKNQSRDKRTLYTCGDLPTTLTDLLERSRK